MDKNQKSITTSYHNHTYLCHHAIGKPIDYVKAAYERGLKEIGISDHGPMPFKKYVNRMDVNEFENVYLKEIDEAQEEYKDIKVLKGLEVEYFKNHDNHYKYLLSKVDYLILGAHVFEKKDNDGDIFNNDLTSDDLYYYTISVIEGIKSGFFKILAHPDIFMLRWTKWDDLTIKLSKMILECAEKYDIIIEMNGNGARRKKTLFTDDRIETYLYPRYEFWELAKQYNVRVIISDDAHNPIFIHDEYTRKVLKLAESLNLKIVDSID